MLELRCGTGAVSCSLKRHVTAAHRMSSTGRKYLHTITQTLCAALGPISVLDVPTRGVVRFTKQSESEVTIYGLISVA
jgi:hypothetical protein